MPIFVWWCIIMSCDYSPKLDSYPQGQGWKFKSLSNGCVSHIFWTAETVTSNFDIVVHHHVDECCSKGFECFCQRQGDWEFKLCVFWLSILDLLNSLLPNLLLTEYMLSSVCSYLTMAWFQVHADSKKCPKCDSSDSVMDHNKSHTHNIFLQCLQCFEHL